MYHIYIYIYDIDAIKSLIIYIWRFPVGFFIFKCPLSSPWFVACLLCGIWCVLCAGLSLCYVQDKVCVTCGL